MGGKCLRKSSWTLVLSVIIILAAGTAQANLTIGTHFTGQTMSDLLALNGGVTLIPPDTDGAVGANHFVELINGAYAVYNKAGGFVQSTNLDQFWVNAGVTPSNGSFVLRMSIGSFRRLGDMTCRIIG